MIGPRRMSAMKALVLTDYKQFSYEDRPAPQPGPEDVLVAVKACGICGSDVHGMDGGTGRRRPPIIMGHEAAGVIAGTGAAVRSRRCSRALARALTRCCGAAVKGRQPQGSPKYR